MTNQINNQSKIPSTDVIQLTLALKMTTAQVVETSVTKEPNEVKDKSVTDIPGGQFSNYTGKDAVH